MNEIEKAIKDLEAYVEDGACCCGEIMGHTIDEGSAKIAITALREKTALVRCCDCMHHAIPERDSEGCIYFLYCDHPHQEKGDFPLIVDFADFCSCGKRLEVEHE